MRKSSHSVEFQSQQNQQSNLLQALNAAAGSLQRSARSRDSVFEAFQEQTAKLGWTGSIMLLDDSNQKLILKALAYPPKRLQLLAGLGRQLNLIVTGYTFPVEGTTILNTVLTNKQPQFVESATAIVQEILPANGHTLIDQLVKIYEGKPVICAPILTNNRILGILTISELNLTQREMTAVEAFANHIAVALENADLFSALEASESRQRMLFDQASDGIFLFDEFGRLIDVNHSGCAMLGFNLDDLVGKEYSELITPANLEEKPISLENLRANKRFVVERHFRRKDGSHIVVEISANLTPDNITQAVVRDITARIESERALRRREKILEAITFAAGQFLKFPSWEDGIYDMLALLGEAAKVSRVYIFKNHLKESQEIRTSQLYEWTAPNIEPMINNPGLQNLHLERAGFGRWIKVMTAGGIIVGNVEDFPVSEQNILRTQSIFSLLVVPIFSHQEWWGFIGFDECVGNRSWETSEIDSLQVAAGTIGAAIERQWINQQERQRRQEAELLMNVTTNLTSTLNLNQVLNNIFVHLQQVVPFVSACIFLMEENGVRAVAGFDLPDQNAVLQKVFSTKDDEFLTYMVKTGQPVVLVDAQSEAGFHSWGETNYVRGWMAVPLIVRENVIGYVTLDSDQVGAYGEEETRLAQAFVNHAAVAIQNAQLFSETQRLLRKTQEQTQQLQQILGIVPDGILLLDSERKVALANKSGESYLSRVAKYSSNGRITHLGPLSIDEIYQPIPTPSPWQEVTSENEQRLYQAAVWPLDQDHPDGFWVLMLQDVTEERANQSYQSAQERLAIVGQMAAGIAHDFNNIMAVIVLYTQLLLQMPDLPPKEEKRLVTIFEQSRRASELIHQILDFSRQSLLERKPLNLTPFMKELVHLLQRTLPENIELILDYQEGSPFINADPTRIQQSIMNLALNARDAMPNGGSLILSLKAISFSKKHNRPLPDMAPGKWLLLQVADTGTGISAENLPHIFEPFFTTKPFGQGTGLGLAQVYGIVKQHEGFIDVRSTPGEGTTFSIYLPVFEPPASVQPRSPVELPTSRKHETILVVEDNKNARLAVIEILEMLNYQTLSASNGSDALSIFEANKEKIDLVLSDVVMPTMDGAALHEALARIDPAVKMIMMTGYLLDQSASEFINDNVVAWMQKPLHTEQIAQTIYQALYETNN